MSSRTNSYHYDPSHAAPFRQSVLSKDRTIRIPNRLSLTVSHLWLPTTFGLLTVAFLVLRLLALSNFDWTHDEGAYISAGWMVSEGYKLYQDTMCSSPPLLIHLLSLFMTVFGHSVAAARLVIVAYCLIGFVFTGFITKELGGWTAAIISSIILFLPADIFDYSLRVFSTVPAMCLITVATFAKIRYFRMGNRGWLILAGLMTAGGLLTKLLVVFAIPMPLVVILLHHSREGHRLRDLGTRAWWREILTDTAVAYLSMLIPVVVYLLLIGPQVTIENIISFQLQGRLDESMKILDNARQMAVTLYDQFPLAVLAGIGAVKLHRIRPLRTLFMIGGGLGLFAFLLSHSPLYDHHISAVFFPLSILAAFEISTILKRLPFRDKAPNYRLTPAYVLEIGVLLIYIVFSLVSLHENQSDLVSLHTPDESEFAAIQFLKRTTGPDAIIISDEPMLPLLANRNILPLLSEVSSKRLRVGDLTSDQLIALTQRHQPDAVVLWKDRFEDTAYDYWIRANYHLAHLDSSSHRIYLNSPDEIPKGHDFTGKLKLLGYNYEAGNISPSRPQLDLTVFWQPLTASGTLNLRFEVMDSTHHVWGSNSGIFHWEAQWKDDEFEFIPDKRALDVRLDAPPGRYYIRITHLREDGEPADEVKLGPIELPSNLK